MNQHDTVVSVARKAVEAGDGDALVELIGDVQIPYWIRQDAANALLQSDNDELVNSVFARLFVDVNKSADGSNAQVVAYWLRRTWHCASEQRMAQARGALTYLAEQPQLSDTLFTALMEGLAQWTQKPLPAKEWTEAARIVRRRIEADRQSNLQRLTDPRLLRAALWSGDLGLMRLCAEIGSGHATVPEHRLMAHFLLSNLVSFSDPRQLLPIAEALYAADPHVPTAIHNLAQVYEAEGRPVAEIAEVFATIGQDKGAHQYRDAVNWIAQKCYADGLLDHAAKFFAMLPDPAPEQQSLGMSWQQKSLKLRSGSEAPIRKPPDGSPLKLTGLPQPLAELLERAADFVRMDMDYSAPLKPNEIGIRLDEIARAVAALPAGTVSVGDCKRAAVRMTFLARAYFAPYRHYAGVSPVPLAEKYGRIDIKRMEAAYRGLMAVASAVAAIGLEDILAGHPLRAMIECLIFLRYFVTGCIGAAKASEALVMLGRYSAAGICSDYVRSQEELFLLEIGDIASASSLLTIAERDLSTVHAVADREVWSARGHVAWQQVLECQELAGQFEVAWPDGRFVRYSHQVPAVRLSIARPGLIRLRRGEIIVGPGGALLRPGPLHYPVGYPDGTPDILARGELGVRLRRLGEPLEISEPVVVFENFDALHHNNYYHWCILLLSRIHYAWQRGLMEGRRLVAPQGLRSWMNASLRAIGLPESAILEVPMDREACLTDVLLLSSVEFATAPLLEPMVRTILRNAPISEIEPQFIYVSRRGLARRPMLNEAEIEEIAQNLGFNVVAPESLTFFEQARLFNNAAGIAAPEGAALTNTMFCRPGTRVLSILSQNDMFPTFNDLSTTMGHDHRKLAGVADRDDLGVNFIWAPYTIDTKLAEQNLNWVLGRVA